MISAKCCTDRRLLFVKLFGDLPSYKISKNNELSSYKFIHFYFKDFLSSVCISLFCRRDDSTTSCTAYPDGAVEGCFIFNLFSHILSIIFNESLSYSDFNC